MTKMKTFHIFITISCQIQSFNNGDIYEPARLKHVTMIIRAKPFYHAWYIDRMEIIGGLIRECQIISITVKQTPCKMQHFCYCHF